MGRGKAPSAMRPKRATGRIETHADRNERMGQALRRTAEAVVDYDADPEAYEQALDELVVSLGTVGANMHSPDPSETLEPEPPSRDDQSRNSLGRHLLWMRKDGLPISLRGPVYDVVVSESRWRKLPQDLRAAITYRVFKRDLIGKSAQYACERLAESSLPKERLEEFFWQMLTYAPAAARAAAVEERLRPETRRRGLAAPSRAVDTLHRSPRPSLLSQG